MILPENERISLFDIVNIINMQFMKQQIVSNNKVAFIKIYFFKSNPLMIFLPCFL